MRGHGVVALGEKGLCPSRAQWMTDIVFPHWSGHMSVSEPAAWPLSFTDWVNKTGLRVLRSVSFLGHPPVYPGGFWEKRQLAHQHKQG